MTATLTLTASRSDGAPHLSCHTIPSGVVSFYDSDGNLVFCWDCGANAPAPRAAAVPQDPDDPRWAEDSRSAPEVGDRVYYQPEDCYGTLAEVGANRHSAEVDWSTGGRTTVRYALLTRHTRG